MVWQYLLTAGPERLAFLFFKILMASQEQAPTLAGGFRVLGASARAEGGE